MGEGISVVIVTYNRPKDVEEAVDSILNQSVKPLEVILIDDGSDPSLNAKYHTRNLKLIRFDNEIGLSNARNHGINAAEGKYVAFIDDDAIASENWLEEIQKGISHGADVLGGPLRPLYEADPPRWWNQRDFGGTAGVGNVGEIWGANFIIRKEVFEKVGYFESAIGRQKGKLLMGEETDLINRARRKGYHVLFMPRAIVFHKVKPKRMTLRYVLKWQFYFGKTQRILHGYQPLKTSFSMARAMLGMANPWIILSKKTDKIKKIAWIANLLGELV